MTSAGFAAIFTGREPARHALRYRPGALEQQDARPLLLVLAECGPTGAKRRRSAERAAQESGEGKCLSRM